MIGAVRDDKDFAAAREHGADEVISSRSSDFAAQVRAHSDGLGASIVLDTSGMMFAEAVEAAALKGRLAVITAPQNGIVTFNLRDVYRKMLCIIGVDSRDLDAVACATMLAAMSPAFQSGTLRAIAGIPRPLSQAAAAYEEAVRGKSRILLRPAE